MKYFVLLFVAGLVGALACSPDGAKQPKLPRAEWVTLINDLAEKLAQQTDPTKMNAQTAQQLVDQSLAFAEKYPKDTLTPAFLFRAADVSRGLNQISQALDIWARVHHQYPESKRAAEALFFQAFTYDKDLKNADAAIPLYQSFLEKYPDHAFARDAQMLMEILQSGKTPEELIREFEQKNQGQ
ncbi:MAG TPA: tetratricopeptide repeat protein [Saprospiraceae bacterium]|nr:tetratricopeptide repeat protein [Saprospiraceae bacterium]HMQ84989.1 tetratricopeptide repeat protein [Saprospiraceae bacterium]